MAWHWASRSRLFVVVLLVVVAAVLILDLAGALEFFVPRYFLLFFAVAIFVLIIAIAERFGLV